MAKREFDTSRYEAIVSANEVKGILVDLAKTGCCYMVNFKTVEDSWNPNRFRNVFDGEKEGVTASIGFVMKRRETESYPRINDNPAVKKFLEKHPNFYKED